MMRLLRIIFFTYIPLQLLLLNSCKSIYPNLMFMDETYVPLAPKIEEVKDAYIIKEGDELSLKVYSRSGINLIDVLKENTITGASQAANYLVDMNGMVDIPILGYYKVKGLKEAELKSKLEAEFEKLFNNPYVVVKVENRRAFVFKGSEAAVVPLNKAPTNLIEVLAKSGGLSSDLKASNIKIIRGNLKKPEVYQVDLSTMKGLTSADLTIQTNDIIYIEERQRPTYKMLTEVIPLVSLPLSIISSIVSIIVIANR